jgi:hypothetical protein
MFFSNHYDDHKDPASNWDQLKNIVKLVAMDHSKFQGQHQRNKVRKLEMRRARIEKKEEVVRIDEELEVLIEKESQAL